MKHIDKLFKDNLYNHEAPVPEGMWEKIAPIAEEEKGRAILWFWFAGILALTLGGFGIYKLLNSNTTIDPSTLVLESDTQTQSNEVLAIESMSIPSIENQEEAEELDIDSKMNTESITSTPSPSTQKKAINTKKSAKPIVKKVKSHTPSTSSNISNTIENIENVQGVPANLVITKSYINKEGSIIKQTNSSDIIGNDNTVYDVIINSEAKDVNASALLRIVEPLENIPLPLLNKELKKKNLEKIF